VDQDLKVIASNVPSTVGGPVPAHLREAVVSMLAGGGGAVDGWEFSPMFTPDGVAVSCVGLTDQERTGHDSFLKVIENNPFGIYLVDSDFKLAKVSMGAQKVFANVFPLLGRDFAEVMRFIWPEPFATEAIATFRHTLETGEPYHSRDTQEKRGDIEEVEAYDWKIERVNMPHGKYGVVCYFYDLTEQMKLRNDMEFLADFVDLLRHGSAEDEVCDAATKRVADYLDADLCYITEIDPKTERLLAVNAVASKDSAPPTILNDTLRSGMTWVCADTNLIPETTEILQTLGVRSLVTAPKMRDDKCVSTFVVGSNEPRTWEKREIALIENLADRLWTTLNALRLDERVRATQRLESIGILAGGVAHDFNNLLTGILGASDLAKSHVQEGTELAGYLETISLAGQRAADLTAQLLAYAGKGKTVVEPLDLVQFINGASQLLKISMPRHVNLVFDLGAGLPDINADRGQIQQVVMNLVLNAAEAFTDGEGGTVTVSVRSSRITSRDPIVQSSLVRVEPGDYVELRVSDDGTGMDIETQTRIFDPFFTTKFMGRGLGLAAVLGIVSAHKGGIGIESSPGNGTTFRVLFPALETTQEAVVPDIQVADLSVGGRVLVVDDEDVVRDFAMAALSGAGYEVLPATNGQEGVEVFSEQPDDISLVLLDLTMPVLDGEGAFEVLRSIRPGVPIVVMSGYSDTDAADRFAGKGLSGFVRKPFSVKGLRSAVQKGIAEGKA
jgi:signal transduction histidine kinase/CheY-like chemotaxis protein